MKLVGYFLDKFQSLTPPDGALKKSISTALHDVVGVTVPVKNISIQNGVAFVKTSSIVKSTIHLSRGKILESIFTELPKARDSLRDVR